MADSLKNILKINLFSKIPRFGLVILFLMSHGLAQHGFGQELTLPKNPLRGRFVFEQKGCISCHAIKGEGGDIGPDLGQKKYYGSFLQLAGIMWNHAPEMLRRMRELELPYPEFSRTEMVELIAYLYYLRYLGEPGDLYRGKFLVEEKGCLACHSIGGKGGKEAPAFDRLAKYISPLYMAQALWNHGPEMEKKIHKLGLKRPKFEKGEIVDLSAYIREASKGSEMEQVYMSPGNPQHGKVVFKEKGCLNCHAMNGVGQEVGPNLGDLELNYSVTEIAGLMWNHGSEMAEFMQEQKMRWPKFTGKEMADLIAYLYFQKFTDKPGDPRAGLNVFANKGCINCHGAGAKGGKYAPALTKSKAPFSTIDMAQIIWNHAPVMEERITEKVMSWPQFTGKEMRDLYAYLSTLFKKNNIKVKD
ncbi:MAG: c-type cytochrome [bacterium]